MKVVLFCGGYGMRMRNGSDDEIPKPMQMIGPRPLIWHVMRYYAHFGHTEFVLCLGYGAEHIKDYFLSYRESASNDFVIRGGKVELLQTDISDWTITFVDTGPESPIGERLRRVRSFLDGDEYFLANYADVLTDAPLNEIIDEVKASGALASMLIVPPQSSFHCVDVVESGPHTGASPASRRCPGCRSGRTAASSCCPPRCSTCSRRTAIWSKTCAATWPPGASSTATSTSVLEACRHLQGTRRTRRRLPQRQPSLGAVGAREGGRVVIDLQTGELREIAVLAPTATTSRSAWAQHFSR